MAATEAAASIAFLGKWGSQGVGDGQFSTPWDLDVGPDGSVYVADSGNGRIQRFTADGGYLGKWGGFRYPFDVTVAPDGSVYVADSEERMIGRFTADGQLIRRWGGWGTFEDPVSLAVGPDGSVYVADMSTSRIHRFTADGGSLGTWTPRGFGFGRPWGVAVAPDGSVYVTSNEITLRFSGDGAPYPTEHRMPGGWEVDVAPDGSVYIADPPVFPAAHEVWWYTAEGHFLGNWGGWGSGDGQFKSPVDVAVASDGGVYVSDQGNHRIERFGAPSSDIGFVRLCVFDSGFIDLGEHSFTVSPPPARAARKPPTPDSVIVPTGDCVFLEFPTDTTVEITEKVDSWWKVESTTVTPTDERRKCRPQAENKVCAHISGGTVMSVSFNNRRTGPSDPSEQ